VKYFLQYLQFR